MYYLDFLASAHRMLAPATYLEIGIRDGRSLALARCRAIGVDPAYAIRAELDSHVTLFRTTSDEYFARPEPLAPTGGRPFDLVFIDGLHLFEFALRDFMHAERHASPRGAVFFDDILPRSVDEAARQKHTVTWTGDVYPVIDVLARYRPELTVLTIDTRPTGLLLVLGLDPDNTVLADHYDEIVTTYRHPDPQPVPDDLLDRLGVLNPNRVLASGWAEILAATTAEVGPGTVRARLAEQLGRTLGSAWAAIDDLSPI